MTLLDHPAARPVAVAVPLAEPSFDDAAKRVDDALSAVERLDSISRAAALELRSAIEAFHRMGLLSIVRALRNDPRGKELLFELVDDPAVHALLLLHSIIRQDPMTRAQKALDTVRPYLHSHGGDVELIELREGIAVVRLQGSCNGCSMSAVTLREGVEEALVSGVEEITGIEVLPNEPTAAFIPLGSIGHKPTDMAGWVQGPSTGDVPAGGLLRVDIDEESFIITNIDNRYSVFRNECVHQGMSLDGGLIDDGVLICPWHGFQFNASSGECLSSPSAQLQQVPMRIESDRVWIRAN